MRNFLKHAEMVGLVTSVVELVWTWVTSAPGSVYYDDDGCLHSTSWVW